MSGKPRKWLLLVPLALAVAVLVLLLRNRSAPEQIALTEIAHPVQVISVPSLTVTPRATAYGNVEPGRVWDAVAEVSGRIIELHPELKKGELIPADTVIVRIDTSDYLLALRQVEADIQASEAQLAELTVSAANAEASLAIEREALRLAEADLARLAKLQRDGTVTQSAFEQEQRTVLNQRQNVQSLTNTLNLIPAQRALLEAQLERLRVQRESAQLNLDRTVIKMPFTGRIAQLNVEQAQFVRQGEVLAVADSIDVAEITVQLPLSRMRPLIQPDDRPVSELSMAAARRALALQAVVRVPGLGLDVSWPARFVRATDAVDLRTRSLGIVVAVDEPYRQAQPGLRPPLIKGMFTEVELRGQTRPDSLVVPLSALHDGQVYVVDAEQRLQRRTLQLASVHETFAVVADGLQAGAKIIVSDLPVAIDGMLLEPVPDPAAQARLQQAVSGTQP